MESLDHVDLWIEHGGTGHPWLLPLVRRLRSLGRTVYYDADSRPRDASGQLTQLEARNNSQRLLHVTSGKRPHLPACCEGAAVLVLPDGELPAHPGMQVFDLSDPAAPDVAEAFCDWMGVPLILLASLFEARSLLGLGPREPHFAHALPPAPRFVGRTSELEQLGALWSQPGSAVISLIGMGGAGKTALASQFLDELTAGGLDPIDGLFVWSFEEDPDAGHFFSSLHEYLSGMRRKGVKGSGWLHLLYEVLTQTDESILVVLDGLERVQRQQHLPGTRFGELEDGLLSEFLKRMTDAPGRCKLLLTSRFPITDLTDRAGYHPLDLSELDLSAALALLQYHQVRGSDTERAQLIETYGRHALTVDHLGALLQRYFDGNPHHAPELGPIIQSQDAQGERLRCIFEAYETLLSPRALYVLTHLCVFRFGVSLETLVNVFGNRPLPAAPGADGELILDEDRIREVVADLEAQHLVLRERSQHVTVHPAIRDHFYHTFAHPGKTHHQVSRHYMNLTERSTGILPEDKRTLDHLEELIHHLIQASRYQEAESIYRVRLGGVWHLTRIGEFARGHRILSQFPRIIDHDGLLRFRRGIGEVLSSSEYDILRSELTFFSANGENNVHLLHGRLKQCSCPTARFLRGNDVAPTFSDDYAPRFSAILIARELKDFLEWRHESFYEDPDGNVWEWEDLWKHVEALTMEGVLDEWVQNMRERDPAANPLSELGDLPICPVSEYPDHLRTDVQYAWLGDHFVLRHNEDPKPRPGLSPLPHNRAVTHLWIAEKFREAGNFAGCKAHVEQAADWILHASSQEHLCLYHLVRARLAIDLLAWSDARGALEEGLRIAEKAEFNIFLIDLLNAKATFHVRRGEILPARASADRALAEANEEVCRYRHGAAVAQSLLEDCRKLERESPSGT